MGMFDHIEGVKELMKKTTFTKALFEKPDLVGGALTASLIENYNALSADAKRDINATIGLIAAPENLRQVDNHGEVIQFQNISNKINDLSLKTKQELVDKGIHDKDAKKNISEYINSKKTISGISDQTVEAWVNQIENNSVVEIQRIELPKNMGALKESLSKEAGENWHKLSGHANDANINQTFTEKGGRQ